MAKDTPQNYRNLVIYQVFVRNHSTQGTFDEVRKDLERIRSMGTDILYFMPISPIGKVARKGSLGSPYSITDYAATNPEYGSLQDFRRLVDEAHQLGLRVMIDIVFNHTAHDSRLVAEHPDWFHQDENGQPTTTVPEWSDVIDLKHPNPGLWDYLIDILIGWARSGVDGFRCDVASLVPVEFWQAARQRVAQVKQGIIWLAESVHAGFVRERRESGFYAASDSELYTAFDMTYDYDIWPIFQETVRRKIPVTYYLDMLRFQDCIYPENYVKMRCVENHDQKRILGLASDRNSAMAWTSFAAFNKGPFFIYAGQEAAADHTPSLFEKDPIQWGDYSLQAFLSRLAGLKKHPAMLQGHLHFHAAAPVIQAYWQDGANGLYGIFNVSGAQGKVEIPLPDGKYVDILHENEGVVRGGRMETPKDAMVFEFPVTRAIPRMPSTLLGFE